ncbi:hypothetical protein E2P81_ATG07620 [Venturia nashicola]|nr:hypothetical protein E2P81_ATG07620 [Venturia nashicola]
MSPPPGTQTPPLSIHADPLKTSVTDQASSEPSKPAHHPHSNQPLRTPTPPSPNTRPFSKTKAGEMNKEASKHEDGYVDENGIEAEAVWLPLSGAIVR